MSTTLAARVLSLLMALACIHSPFARRLLISLRNYSPGLNTNLLRRVATYLVVSQMHRALQTVGLLAAIIGLILMIVAYQNASLTHFDSLHAKASVPAAVQQVCDCQGGGRSGWQ